MNQLKTLPQEETKKKKKIVRLLLRLERQLLEDISMKSVPQNRVGASGDRGAGESGERRTEGSAGPRRGFRCRAAGDRRRVCARRWCVLRSPSVCHGAGGRTFFRPCVLSTSLGLNMSCSLVDDGGDGGGIFKRLYMTRWGVDNAMSVPKFKRKRSLV